MRNLLEYKNYNKKTAKISKNFVNRDILELAVVYYRYTNFTILDKKSRVTSIDSKVVHYLFIHIHTHNVGEFQIRTIQHTYETMYKYISIQVRKLTLCNKSKIIKHKLLVR